MPILEDLMLTEEFTPPQPGQPLPASFGLELPSHRRTPITAGYVLTWTEHRGGTTERRRGMVLMPGPKARSVWVVPEQPRVGEGYGVLVREVTAAGAAGAVRHVGGRSDFYSTEEWQNPFKWLPRAWERTDRLIGTDGEVYGHSVNLHVNSECRGPVFPFQGERIELGFASLASTCYVFADRYLHPWSFRPVHPTRAEEYIPLCLCFKAGLPDDAADPDEQPATDND